MKVQVLENVLEANDEFAQMVRNRLAAHRVTVFNLISAPGSGKTCLLEAAARRLKGILPMGVIEGDPDTTLDAERIARLDVPVVQVNTAGGCHLDAHMVFRSLDSFDFRTARALFIENVGNLVCPVEFDLGEDARVAVVSTAEGHDKPAKYPMLFRTAHVVVLNKIDLLGHVDFSESQFRADVERLKPGVPVIRVSCRTGQGVDEWVSWIQATVAGKS